MQCNWPNGAAGERHGTAQPAFTQELFELEGIPLRREGRYDLPVCRGCKSQPFERVPPLVKTRMKVDEAPLPAPEEIGQHGGFECRKAGLGQGHEPETDQ